MGIRVLYELDGEICLEEVEKIAAEPGADGSARVVRKKGSTVYLEMDGEEAAKRILSEAGGRVVNLCRSKNRVPAGSDLEPERDDGKFAGRLYFWSPNRAYGFIGRRQDDQKFFVHISGCSTDLQEEVSRWSEGRSVPVIFNNGGRKPGKEYPQAINVEIDEEAPMF